MKHFLILSTIAILALLMILGIYAPTSDPMLFAATTQNYIFIRAGLIMILFSLLIYDPPRERIFRVALGIIATILLVCASTIIVNYDVKFFDALLLLQTSILLYIEAAELGIDARSAPRKIPVSEHAPKRNKLRAA